MASPNYPQGWHLVWLMGTTCSEGIIVWWVYYLAHKQLNGPFTQVILQLYVFYSTFQLLWKARFSYFHVPCICYKLTSDNQNSAMSYDYLRHVANYSCMSLRQNFGSIQKPSQKVLYKTLDGSLLPSSNNSQSQSRLTTTEDNVDDGAKSYTMDHQAYVVDGQKKKQQRCNFYFFKKF